MNVSKVARRVGIAPTAVRFYERRGVLPVAARRRNGYRDYTEDDLCRLRIVVTLRGMGLELPECGRLAALCQDGKCDVMEEQLVTRIDERRQAIARTRAELDHLDRELEFAQRAISQKGRMLPLACCVEGALD